MGVTFFSSVVHYLAGRRNVMPRNNLRKKKLTALSYCLPPCRCCSCWSCYCCSCSYSYSCCFHCRRAMMNLMILVFLAVGHKYELRKYTIMALFCQL